MCHCLSHEIYYVCLSFSLGIGSQHLCIVFTYMFSCGVVEDIMFFRTIYKLYILYNCLT